MSRELKRWQAISLATAIVLVPILSCSQRSLVLVTVDAPQGVTYQSAVSVVMQANDLANGTETTTFDNVVFTGGVYKAGIYLPSDMSGTVMLSAEVVKDSCQIATSDRVNSPDVSSGATVSLTIGLIAQACVPVDGGAGSSGTGGTATGSGGSGTGGARGTGGLFGTGGNTPGSGGAVGSGGVVGTGGMVGTGGVVGTGGLIGSGGHGGSATGGAIGSGGVISTGGVIGTGGFIGSGGVVGSGGKGGSASGGTLGTGGVVGSGGGSGCTCPDPNEICQPGTTTCICSQDDTTACAGATCGTATNLCNQTVSCGVCPSGYVCDTSLNACRKLVVTGCGGSVSTGTGLVAGTAAAPICPLN